MRTILVVALIMLSGLAQSSLINQMFMYAPVVNSTTTVGHVMARAQVIGPNGGPILVKVRSSGSAGQSSTVEIEEIGEAYAGGPLDGVYVLSGAAYRDVLRQLAQLRARYPERMARAEFLPAQQLASGLPLADGSRSPGITLPDHIKTVVVWGRQDRLAPGTDAHIILTAPFQLDAGTALPEDVSSLLMNPDGSIRSLAHGSGVGGDSFNVESFTWRTAFYAQPGSTEQSDKRLDRINDQIFGPIALASLEQYGWFGAMHSVTDAEGQYGVTSRVLCLRNALGGYLTPGIESSLILTVPTVPFNPNRLGTTPYYELRYLFMPCSDDPALYRMDFLIDVLWLVGELHLSNTPGGAAIPVGSSVSYEGQDRSGEPTVRVWDYDGDGEADKAILANKITVTDPQTQQEYVVPEQANDGAWQAVYFSSGTRRPDADALADRVPDLWRLADRTLDGRPTGLLTEISEDALRHTDVYIFRESTGELLVEVSGLPEGPYAGRASRIENNAYLWHTLLRGRESFRNNFAAYGTASGSRPPDREDAFRERSAELGFSSRYQSRDADMPAPGEMLHVVAINRVTGYTGSVRFELGAANSPGGAQQRVPRLELLPPNVRVWAQRLTEIEAGLTAGEQREYLISHEGAHTANDLIVGLYTDWRAADGSPLPNALGQLRGADFGLTGRLAKVRDGQLVPVTAGQALDSSITLEDALAAGSQGAVAEFPIGPGQNLQLLRLPNAETGGNEHYYVNLFGRALNKEVCSHCQYDQAGLHPTLAGRPNHFAPVLVPRFDRGRTDAERQAARAWAKENNESVPDTPAHHQWVLRPEYQFSQLDFSVDEITASYVDDEGNLRSRNLLEDPAPIVTRPDELMDIFYGLVLPLEEMLPGYDGQRQYVIAVGDEEFLIDPDSLDPVRYEDIDRLARVLNSGTPGDYLTVRLFLQHDPENLLWEWAFGKNGLQIVFEYPGDELIVAPEVETINGRATELYRMLGGVRLHYRFNFPQGAVPHSMEMWIDRTGRVCPEMPTQVAGCITHTATPGPVSSVRIGQWTQADVAPYPIARHQWGLYWEPEDWSLGLDARLRVNVSYWMGNILVQYTDRPLVQAGLVTSDHEPIIAQIRNRLLQPTTPDPMQGTDVAMLEAMLWQLGLSPQRGANYRAASNAGSEGARIASNRSGSGPVNTLTCQGQPANRRDVFYVGWGSNCPAGHVSLEGMVRRFNGRNQATGDGVRFDQHYGGDLIRYTQGSDVVSGDPVSGTVDDSALVHLMKVWLDYLVAYDAFSSLGMVGFSSPGMDDWISSGLELWELGDEDAGIEPTYLVAEHQLAVELQGQELTDAFSRTALFRAWKAQEAPYHWGNNEKSYQSTPYRITEGGADEVGSFGFSQIKYAYQYGDENLRCSALQPYNLYNPIDAIRGMIAFVSASPVRGNENCTKSFYFGFAEQGRWRSLAGPREELRGYVSSSGGQVAISEGRIDDAYERLMKSLAGYNGMTSLQFPNDRTWAHVLRVAHTTEMGNAISNRLYAMDIRHRFGLQGRSYVWFGGRWPEDAMTEDEEGNMIPHPEAGEDWCFVYGEAEWHRPETVSEPGSPDRPATFDDYRLSAEDDESMRMVCP